MWGVIILVVGLCIIGWFWFSLMLYVDFWNLYYVLFFSVVGFFIVMMLWVFFGLEFVCVNIDVVENLECNVLIVVFGGMLGVVVIYIVFINVIVGIVLNMELVNLMVLFGLVFV